nr:hypothetical protein [Candidatus Sigynarchaeota archaeon]
MNPLLESLGSCIERPETAWTALAEHKATRAVMIVIGLYSFSRLVSILLDVHRASFIDLVNGDPMQFYFGSLDRGTFWHSLVIGSYACIVVFMTCAIFASIVAGLGKKNARLAFIDFLAAMTVRFPIIFGIGLIISYFSPVALIYKSTVVLAVWAAAFGLGIFEMWRVSGKIAVKYDLKPRIGILSSVFTSIGFTAIVIGITELIGGFS